MKYNFTIQCDHYQFYIEDRFAEVDSNDLWNDVSSNDMFVVARGLIGVGTVRYGGNVNVSIEIQDHKPIINFDDWDQIVECSIVIESGTIFISSPEMPMSSSPYISITRGTYRAAICYGGLDLVKDDNTNEGEDYYQIMLWPEEFDKSKILKRWQKLA